MIFPSKIIVVGDSLAACCPFKRLSRRPFAVQNLAKGGAKLADIAGQLPRTRQAAAGCVIADGGLNDLLGAGASLAQIEKDFRALLQRLESADKTIFTLMPHVAEVGWSQRIDAANALIADLCAASRRSTSIRNYRLSAHAVPR